MDSGKKVGYLGKEPPLLEKKDELKIKEARMIWKNLISHGGV